MRHDSRATVRRPNIRSTALVCCAIFLAGAALCSSVGIVFGGDSREYVLLLLALGTQGDPTITEATQNTWLAELPETGLGSFGLVPFRPGSHDTTHFWALSAFALPFYFGCKLLGIGWEHAFIFLDWFWFSLTLFVAGYTRGWLGMSLVGLGILSSPLIAYFLIPHPELFVVCLTTIALLFLIDRKYLLSSAALCLISVQVTAFSPLALLLLFVWVLKNRRRKPSWSEALIAMMSVGCLTLQPIYYLFRHQTANLILAQGYLYQDMATPKRMLALLIDPDVGLLPNWPGALGFLLLGLICTLVSTSWIRDKRLFWGFTGLFVLVMPYIQSQQVNFTTGSFRYAYWYIPFLLVAAVEAVVGLPPTTRRKRILLSAGVVFAGLTGCSLYYNSQLFGVSLPSFKRRPIADWFYESFPKLYNPDKEVFLEKSIEGATGNSRALFAERRPEIPGLTDAGVWAVANSACNKLLVLPAGLDQTRSNYRRPRGCKIPVDGTALVKRLRESKGIPDSTEYITIPSSWARELTPSLNITEVLSFSRRDSEKYLGRGWHRHGERWGPWSEGREAEMGFRIRTENQGSQSKKIDVSISYVLFADHVPEQVVDCYANGEHIGTIAGRNRGHVQFPLRATPGDKVDLVFRVAFPRPPSRDWIHSSPGIGLMSLTLIEVD